MDGLATRPDPRGALSHEEARAFYDRFGRKQDLKRVYEDPAIKVLLEYAGFESAKAVVELGCGTGRLAARLLEECLPSDATYVGFDISRTMVELAQNRVAPGASRAKVQLTDGSASLGVGDDAADRFLSTYVFDLLSAQEIRTVLGEAQRLLVPGGLPLPGEPDIRADTRVSAGVPLVDGNSFVEPATGGRLPPSRAHGVCRSRVAHTSPRGRMHCWHMHGDAARGPFVMESAAPVARLDIDRNSTRRSLLQVLEKLGIQSHVGEES